MKNLLLLMAMMLVTFSFTAYGAKISSDELKIGKAGSVADKLFKLGDTREIRSNETTGVLEFTNDGSIFKKLGSGEGGGAGGINLLSNTGFEDGIGENWTCSGGACAEDSTVPLVGLKSLAFTSSATGENFRSDLFRIENKMLDGACQATVTYIGGDDNLVMNVFDGDDNLLTTQAMQAHQITGPESIGFNCPSSSTATTENLKSMYLEVDSLNATLTATFDDTMYLGEQIGNVSLRDKVTQTYQILQSTSAMTDRALEWEFNLGTATETKDGADLIDSEDDSGNTRTKWVAQEDIEIFFLADNPQTANIQNCILKNDSLLVSGNGPTTTGIYAIAPLRVKLLKGDFVTIANCGTSRSLSGSLPSLAAEASVYIYAEALRQIEVFESAPTVAQNLNKFTAKVSAAGVVSLEGSEVDWIDGDASIAVTSQYTLDFVDGIFESGTEPVCDVFTSNTVFATGANEFTEATSSGVTIRTFRTDSSASTAMDFRIECSKQNIKLPLTQHILVGGGYHSANRNERASKVFRLVFGGAGDANTVCSSSPCTTHLEKGGDWIDGNVTRSGAGSYTFSTNAVFNPNEVVNCSCSGVGVANKQCGIQLGDGFQADSNGVLDVILILSRETGALADAVVSYICFSEG